MRYLTISVITFLGLLVLLPSCGSSGNSGRQAYIRLQVQYAPVILTLSNNPRDVALQKAVTYAAKGPADGRFVDRFATAYAAAGGNRLSPLFVKPSTTNISLMSSDADVITFLKRETSDAAKHTAFILMQRLDTIGGGDRHWELNDTTGIIMVSFSGTYSAQRLRTYLQSRDKVIYESHTNAESISVPAVIQEIRIDN
jgi:hypothetical protein